jgi:hypothetical protein
MLFIVTFGSLTKLAITVPTAILGATTPTFANFSVIPIAVPATLSLSPQRSRTATDLATIKSNSIKTNRKPTKKMAARGLSNLELETLQAF